MISSCWFEKVRSTKILVENIDNRSYKVRSTVIFETKYYGATHLS